MIVDILRDTKSHLNQFAVVGGLEHYLKVLSKDFLKINSNFKFKFCPENHYLIVSGNNPSSQIVTSHVDRHGFVVNSEGEFEFAAFRRGKMFDKDVGRDVPKKFIEKLYSSWIQKLVGLDVMAYNSRNGKVICEGRIQEGIMDLDNLKLSFNIDGISDLEPETCIGYKPNYKSDVEYFSGQIDNCVSSCVMLEMFRRGYQGSLILTDDEECGNSHRNIFRALKDLEITETNQLVVLDTTPFNNIKPLKEGIVVLRNRDEFGVFNQKMVSKTNEELRRYGVQVLFKDKHQEEIAKRDSVKVEYGKTELGIVAHNSNDLINGATIQLPTTRYHTNSEMASKEGLFNYALAVRTILGL